MGDHHAIPGRRDGRFDVAGVFRPENGHNVLAHHLGEGLGGEEQVGAGVVKLEDQRDTVGQDLFFFNLLQSVRDGSRN